MHDAKTADSTTNAALPAIRPSTLTIPVTFKLPKRNKIRLAALPESF
jgi:hypothetical protein